ncbi:MAG: DUF3524 domain-containing protein [Halioglobus sp.]
MRVLLLSAYAANSHVQWRKALQSMFPHWQWTVLELPPRHFSWRVRGNPLHWALAERERLESPADLLLATSMVDVATLRGLVPTLAELPLVLYFHENQFDYPPNKGNAETGQNLLEAQIVSLYSALAADRLLFNSRYNLDTFVGGVARLMSRLPDYVPPNVAGVLRDKSDVLSVPVEQLGRGSAHWPQSESASRPRKLRLLWCGRFEYDKGPEHLLCTLSALERRGLDYELALVGQQFRNMPDQFEVIATEFSHRLVHFGYVDAAAHYRGLLRGADIVLSTSLHEFQGLAPMEAVAAGCIPVVPDRLAYREFYPACFRYASSPEAPMREAEAAAELIEAASVDSARFQRKLPDLARFSPQHLAPEYERLMRSALIVRDGH